MSEPTPVEGAGSDVEPIPASLIVTIGLVAVGAHALFVALAIWRPETTWHLAPVLAAAAPAMVARSRVRRPFDLAAAALSCLAIATLGELVVLGLWETELLRGPTLIGAGEAAIEHLAGVIVGALYGWRVLTRERQGLL